MTTALIPEEVEFIELASGVRKVRTPEGSKFYGLPIGAPITADVIAAKKAEGATQGLTPPKGALSKGTSSSYKDPSAPAAEDGAPATVSPAAQITQIPSTLTGPLKFKVGEKSYNAPAGSTLIKPKAKEGILYVRTKDGQVHAFNAVDEVVLPDMLQKLFASKFGPSFKGDDNYEMQPFEDGEGKSLDDLPEGAELKDDEGVTQFKKMANGDWENPELGAIVTSADLQEMYDSGELTSPDTATGIAEEDFPNYADMSKLDFTEAMDALPTGHKIHMANVTFVKNADGTWHNPGTGKDVPRPPYSMRKMIKPQPTASVADKYEQDVKSAEAKGEEPPKLPKSLEDQPPAPKAEDKVDKPAPVEKTSQELIEGAAIGFKDSVASGKLTQEQAETGLQVAANHMLEQGQISLKGFKKAMAILQGEPDTAPEKKTPITPKPGKKRGEDGLIGQHINNIKKTPSKDRPEGEPITTEAELEELPVGHVIVEETLDEFGETFEYTKNEDGSWNSKLGTGYSSAELITSVQDGETSLKSLQAIKKPDVKKARVDTKTQLKSADIAAMKAGESIFLQNSDLNMQFVATKQSDGQWLITSEEGGGVYDGEGIGIDVDNGVAHRYVFDRKKLQSKKAGDKISINVPGEKQIVATKNEDGTWAWNGKSHDESMLHADIEDGFVVEVLPTDINTENAERIKKIEEAVAKAAEEDNGVIELPEGKVALDSFDGLSDGDELEVYSTKGKLVMTLQKDPWNGKWVDNGTPGVPVTWSEEDLGAWLADGHIVAKYGKPQVGAKITKAAQLDELPEGAEVKNHLGIKVTKIYNNLWTTNGSDEIYSESLQPWLDVSTDETNSVVVSSLPASAPAEETMQVFSSGPVVPKSAVQAALDGLEGHSGFQIAYGLKGLPADSPFKDEEFLSSLKAESAAAFPDLKPKPALVAHLKAKLGQTEGNFDKNEVLADWEKELMGIAPEPSVLIGSEESKETQTGSTGGSFKLSDIEQAITLLEGFEGKNFKSFLNLQGNPLGKLSPNHIVGFNKDKTITKKNFVDLLKKKVADNKVAAPEPAPEPAPAPEPEAAPTSWHAGDPVSYETIDTLPIDTVLGFDDGDGSDNSKWFVKQISPGVWQHTKNKNWNWSKEDLQSGLEIGLYWVETLPEGYTPAGPSIIEPTPVEEAPEPEKPKVTTLAKEIVVSWDEFTKLPVGSKVFYSSEYTDVHDFYTLDADGKWHDDSYHGSYFATHEFEAIVNKGQITLWGYEGEEPKVEKPAEPVSEKVLTKDEFNATEIGDVISVQLGSAGKPMIFTKTSDTIWTNNKGGGQTTHEGLAEMLDGSTTITLKPTLKHATKITGAQFDKLQAGSIVSVKTGSGNEVHYIKKDTGQFKHITTGALYENSQVKAFVGDGLILVSVPNEDFGDDKPNPDSHVPDFAAPTAADAEKSQTPIWTDEQVDAASAGTLLQNSADPEIYYQKEADGGTSWQSYKNGQPYGIFHSNNVKEWVKNGTVKPVDAPENPSGLVPGKYSSTGKTFMYVNADGTGVYVNTKGVVSALTVAKVKANYKAGMKTYYGASETPPKVSIQQAVAAKAKKPLGDIADLPDGKFYLGSPSSPGTTVYEVEGDKVTIFKPKKVLSGLSGDVKVGQKINNEFLQLAPVGSTLHYKDGSYYQYDMVKVSNEGELEEQWKPAKEGVVLPGWFFNEMKNTWYHKHFKITSMGPDVPETVDKSKLKTQFLKGQLLDSLGNSVVPKNYSGAVYFFESATDIQSLLGMKAALDEWQPGEGMNFSDLQKKFGLNVNQAVIKAEVEKTNNGYSPDAAVKYMAETIGNLTKDLDTDIPESDASGVFEWDAAGYAKMPLEVFLLDTPSYYYSTGQYSEYIKTVSSHFGGGAIIGQHYTWMTKDQKNLWVAAFKSGNFKKMYEIEVEAAASKNKPHASGFLHPGYASNTNTHQISWGPVVSGEIPAGATVEGEWTSGSIEPSMEEINNYLIKAQMQNPTFLNNAEKRVWVKYHKNGNSAEVDKLSATALHRKQTGQSPVSEAPVWTDDVKPSKSYDSLFDTTEFPTGWTSVKANDWLEDNWNKYPDLQQHVTDHSLSQGYGHIDSPSSGNIYIKQQAVESWFQKKKAEYDAELLKPVYTKEPNQTVKKSTHPVFNYTDQFGNKYFFKPRADTKLDKYRSEVEHFGNKFGHLFGFKTADSKLLTLDGKYGQLQSDVGGVADLMNYDYSTLSVSQIVDIGAEHLLDWFLDNDDTKGDNAKILPSGHIVGIDKGRAFKHFGAWDGLSGDSSMNSNAHTIYSQLYDTIRAGKISKADADAAFLKIRKKALQMSKVSDQKITDMLAEAMKNREDYDVQYKINGKKVSQDLKGLTAAVLDRKNRMPEQIEEMWAKIYKQAGLGELPQVPDTALGEEHYSGFGESHFHDAAFTVNAGGVSTLLGGNFSTNGAATVWGTVNKDGSKEMYSQIELNEKTDEQVLSKLQSMKGTASGPSGSTAFSPTEYGAEYSRDYYRVMATIIKHSDTNTPNPDRVAEYKEAKIRMQKDWDFWQPDLQPNSVGNIVFPSGAEVPQVQLGQYYLMMEYYRSKEQYIDAALDVQADFPVAEKQLFQPYPIASTPKVYSKGAESMVELADGSWLYHGPSSVAPMSNDDAQAKISSEGWQELNVPTGPELYGGATVELKHDTFETKGAWDSASGEIGTGSQGVGGWTQGSEYAVTLPTGEIIYFRNRSKTSTLKSQSGRLTIKVPKAADSSAYAAGVERAQEWIASYLGIDLEGADEESAELIYWKNMLPILVRRNHMAGSKYQKAFNDIQAKAKDLGVSTNDFGYEFGSKASVTEQIEFYRKVWGDQFGKDKVDALVAEQKYLPSYEGTDLSKSDMVQGRPKWYRFDISLADMLSGNDGGAFAASGSHGGSTKERVKAVSMSGSHLSTEERIRFFGGIDGGSSSSDQSMGTGGQDQFTRIWDDANSSSYDFVYHPSVLLHTNTRFFHTDAFGSEDYEMDYANPDALDAWKNRHLNSAGLGGGNQLDIRWASSWLGSLEMTLFDDIHDRDEAIQHLKKLGLDTIRGLPVEDRLVMRQNRVQAIAKLREHWKKEAGL